MKYNPAFDGLRALAATAVVIFHCSRETLPGGFVGVDLFFVLSGFLISSILLEERERTGTIAFGRFYFRRALRLWPPLMLMLAAYLIAALFVFPEANARRDALLAGLYLSDYSQAFWRVPYLPLLHTWSLAVEEHFYLLWPLVVFWLARADRRVAAGILAVIFVLASLWRMVDLVTWRDFTMTFYRFDTRMSGLILGSLIAFMPWRPKAVGANIAATTAVVLIAWAMMSLHLGTAAPLLFSGAVVDIGAGAIVLALAADGSLAERFLSARPLPYMGKLSYSIYLWHYPIVVAMRAHPSEATPLPAAAIVFVVVASTLAAVLSYEMVEKPIKALREKARLSDPLKAG